MSALCFTCCDAKPASFARREAGVMILVEAVRKLRLPRDDSEPAEPERPAVAWARARAERRPDEPRVGPGAQPPVSTTVGPAAVQPQLRSPWPHAEDLLSLPVELDVVEARFTHRAPCQERRGGQRCARRRPVESRSP